MNSGRWTRTPGPPNTQTWECSPVDVPPEVDKKVGRPTLANELLHANQQLTLQRQYPGRAPKLKVVE
jgi:hypothetical protein